MVKVSEFVVTLFCVRYVVDRWSLHKQHKSTAPNVSIVLKINIFPRKTIITQCRSVVTNRNYDHELLEFLYCVSLEVSNLTVTHPNKGKPLHEPD